MRFVSLAWRNVQRNRRRTALTFAAIAIGVVALTFAWSLFDGANAQMVNNMTGNYTGYIQIHTKGYSDDPTLERTFGSDQAVRFKFASIPGAIAVSPRIEARSLVSSDSNSRGILDP
jgi:putative ABC transport system permease protein